jgi:teichuronic acid biosynthesis glycosyltransferase TuaG
MEETGAALSFTDYRVISEDGSLIGRRITGPSRVGWRLHHATRYLGCLTVMVNRELCTDFSFGQISPAIRAEDFLAWSRILLKHGPALRCPHDLARYAVVQNSRSSNRSRAARSVWRLYRRVEKIPALPACAYFLSYAASTLIKRWRHRPQWPRQLIDG